MRITAGKYFQWQILLLLFLLFIPALSYSTDSLIRSDSIDSSDAINGSDSINKSAEKKNIDDIDIYVNSSVPDQQYSLAEVRAIFAMRKTIWPDGTKIKVFVLPDNASKHRLFTKSRLHMFPHQFRRIWDRLTFSGAGQAPVEVESFEEMFDRLSNTPGSIGYLKAQHYHGNIRKLNYE